MSMIVIALSMLCGAVIGVGGFIYAMRKFGLL